MTVFADSKKVSECAVKGQGLTAAVSLFFEIGEQRLNLDRRHADEVHRGWQLFQRGKKNQCTAKALLRWHGRKEQAEFPTIREETEKQNLQQSAEESMVSSR